MNADIVFGLCLGVVVGIVIAALIMLAAGGGS